MRWGKMAVLGLATLVGLGLGMVVAQPWDSPTVVDALELDDARRDDDVFDGEVRDDDDDDDDGTRTGNGATRSGAAGATDDGRDGTRDGDTSHGAGTGTGVGNSATGVSNTGGNTNGGDTGGNTGGNTVVSNTNGGNTGGGSATGGGDT